MPSHRHTPPPSDAWSMRPRLLSSTIDPTCAQTPWPESSQPLASSIPRRHAHCTNPSCAARTRPTFCRMCPGRRSCKVTISGCEHRAPRCGSVAYFMQLSTLVAALLWPPMPVPSRIRLAPTSTPTTSCNLPLAMRRCTPRHTPVFGGSPRAAPWNGSPGPGTAPCTPGAARKPCLNPTSTTPKRSARCT